MLQAVCLILTLFCAVRAVSQALHYLHILPHQSIKWAVLNLKADRLSRMRSRAGGRVASLPGIDDVADNFILVTSLPLPLVGQRFRYR